MNQDKPPTAPSSTHRDPAVPASPHRASLSRAAFREKVAEETFSHPLNPNSKIHGRTLSDGTGLERIGIHVIRVPAGKESFVYHRHRMEEEFVYILSGRGIAEIDGEEPAQCIQRGATETKRLPRSKKRHGRVAHSPA
jgi:mannose-6-phosphate isomerase-like protein (cupin superfamily)